VSRLAVSLVLSAVFLAACTSENLPPSTQSASTTNGSVVFDTGIHGTLTRSGTTSGDALLEGQILVWATSEDEPTGTTTGITLFGRPTEAVLVDNGEFAVELGPGWYRVRGTVFGAEVCGEFVVEVKPNEVTQVDFVCSP
jgi:hypothetical protein